MVYLASKPKKGAAWLPSQVVYGMDCSDADPENWTPFGQAVEVERAKAVSPKRPFETTKAE